MKKHVTLLLMVLCIAVFSSCSRPQAHTSIDLDADTPMSVFDLFSEVKVIPLETTPDNLISQIGQVEYFEGNYYILDGTSQQIFCFTEQGDFVFKISAKGKGPGEYHHLSGFTIDGQRKQLILMDPVVQRVHAFDLSGQHVETMAVPTEIMMGFSDVFVLNDSILMLSSVTNEYLTFYNRNDKKVAGNDYFMKEFLQAFLPRNEYQLNGKTYVIPPLSQQVMDVSDVIPDSSFAWCFGQNNNTQQQIDRLRKEIESMHDYRSFFQFPHEAVGQGKYLNNHIVKVGETERYRIALVEYNNDNMHVVIDKKENKTHIFSQFTENLSLFGAQLKSDRAICFEKAIKDYYVNTGHPELINRCYDSYLREILPEEGQRIYDNHDPMNENPFLVVYFFRE